MSVGVNMMFLEVSELIQWMVLKVMGDDHVVLLWLRLIIESSLVYNTGVFIWNPVLLVWKIINPCCLISFDCDSL